MALRRDLRSARQDLGICQQTSGARHMLSGACDVLRSARLRTRGARFRTRGGSCSHLESYWHGPWIKAGLSYRPPEGEDAPPCNKPSGPDGTCHRPART